MWNGLNLYMCVYICTSNKDHKSNLNLKNTRKLFILIKHQTKYLFILIKHQTKYLDLYQCTHEPLNKFCNPVSPIFKIPTWVLNHLGNETRADLTVQIYRLTFPLAVRIWHKLVFWQEIKTPTHLRHCRDSSKVEYLHLGPAMSPESPAPREPGI